MEPRDTSLDVPPNGSAYLRLKFFSPSRDAAGSAVDVYLFLNDDCDRNEESYLFRVRESAATH
jgi:hypothetical protein